MGKLAGLHTVCSFIVKMGRLGTLGQIYSLGCDRLGREVLMGFRVTEIQPTPNPNAVKLMLDGSVSQQPMSFFNAAAAQDHPLAAKLFAIEGVSTLLLLGDFITIN